MGRGSCQVKTFLWCADLRTGCIVVAILAMCMAFVHLATSCVIFDVKLPSSLMIELYVFAAVDVVLSVIMIGASILLLAGSIQYQKTPVKPWPYGAIPYCILRIAMTVLLIFCWTKMGMTPWMLFSIVVNIINIFILMYSLAVVCSYFTEGML